jgi:hypothetical protein
VENNPPSSFGFQVEILDNPESMISLFRSPGFNRRTLDKMGMNLAANWLEFYRKQFGSNSNGFFRPNSIRPHSI